VPLWVTLSFLYVKWFTPRAVAAQQDRSESAPRPTASPMRDGIINKAWTLPDGNRPRGSKSGCSFFPLYYQAGNFIAGWRSI
jgi:hypothetical protein